MTKEQERKRFKEVTQKAREMDQRKKSQVQVQERAKELTKQREKSQDKGMER